MDVVALDEDVDTTEDVKKYESNVTANLLPPGAESVGLVMGDGLGICIACNEETPLVCGSCQRDQGPGLKSYYHVHCKIKNSSVHNLYCFLQCPVKLYEQRSGRSK